MPIDKIISLFISCLIICISYVETDQREPPCHMFVDKTNSYKRKMEERDFSRWYQRVEGKDKGETFWEEYHPLASVEEGKERMTGADIFFMASLFVFPTHLRCFLLTVIKRVIRWETIKCSYYCSVCNVPNQVFN